MDLLRAALIAFVVTGAVAGISGCAIARLAVHCVDSPNCN